MTTPHNHVLIDYENVQPEVASRLAPGFFKVWVFVDAAEQAEFELMSPGCLSIPRAECHRHAKLNRFPIGTSNHAALVLPFPEPPKSLGSQMQISPSSGSTHL